MTDAMTLANPRIVVPVPDAPATLIDNGRRVQFSGSVTLRPPVGTTVLDFHWWRFMSTVPDGYVMKVVNAGDSVTMTILGPTPPAGTAPGAMPDEDDGLYAAYDVQLNITPDMLVADIVDVPVPQTFTLDPTATTIQKTVTGGGSSVEVDFLAPTGKSVVSVVPELVDQTTREAVATLVPFWGAGTNGWFVYVQATAHTGKTIPASFTVKVHIYTAS